jgi:hypothetical protein
MISAENDTRIPTWSMRLAGARPWLCRIVPAAAIIFFLAWCYVSLRSNFSCDDAEPEILNQAWQLARGGNIYRGIEAPPFAFAAYSPLYYALAAFLMKFTGLSFLPAKLISFLSALSIGWAMVRLNREWNKTAQGGVWAAFFLFLIPAFLYNSARSHVQMMAVALCVWSLVFFLRNRWTETVIISPLLAVLAVYTKQSQLALPLAMAIYLALRNRRWFLPYVVTGTVAGLIPLLYLQKATGGNFLFNTIQLARLAYSVGEIPLIFFHYAGPIFLFIGLALVTSWRRFRDGSWEPIDLYLGCVFVLTLVSLGRLGAHGQYVLELLVVTLLYLLRTTGLPLVRGRDVMVSLQILFLLIYTPLFIFLEEGPWDLAGNQAAKKIYPLLKADSGPILSQQGSFALFSRGEIFIQLFHFSALSRAGFWNQDVLLKEIGDHTFSWVITEFPIEEPATENAPDKERFTPEMLEALRKNYQRREAFYPYYLYNPRLQVVENSGDQNQNRSGSPLLDYIK